MSSSKTDSSTNKRQKNPEIKIVDTSFGRFKITEETKDTEEDHPNNQEACSILEFINIHVILPHY